MLSLSLSNRATKLCHNSKKWENKQTYNKSFYLFCLCCWFDVFYTTGLEEKQVRIKSFSVKLSAKRRTCATVNVGHFPWGKLGLRGKRRGAERFTGVTEVTPHFVGSVHTPHTP